MDKVVQQGIKDIKYVMHLNKDQEEYIKIVLQEMFINGERSELIDGLARSKKIISDVFHPTEEQLIEEAKEDKSVVTNSSEIL